MSSSRSLASTVRPLLQSSSASRQRVAPRSSIPSTSAASTSALHTSSIRAAPPTPPTAAASPSSAAPVPAPAEPHAPAAHLPRLARKDAALYAALRPPPVSAIAALAARLNLLPSSLDAATRARRIQLVYQACTHPSFHDLIQKANDDAARLVRTAPAQQPLDALQYLPHQHQLAFSAPAPADDVAAATATMSHTALATVGNSLLGMIASEYLHLRYPNLPTRVLKAAVAAHVGPSTLADVGGDLGLGGQGILRWNRHARVASKVLPTPTPANGSTNAAGAPSTRTRSRGLLSRDVTADAMRALVAIIFQELGLSAARHFITTHMLTRNLDMASLLKFFDPKRALSATCAKYGREAPQSRLVAESGRLSISPIFVVGVYSGTQKIGEGSGSAIKMAEYRAAEDALRRLYFAQTPLDPLNLPSTTLDAQYPSSDGRKPFIPSVTPVYHGEGDEYRPLPLGACEVLEAAGKDR